jgi:3-keto-disaccharide hydrolase
MFRHIANVACITALIVCGPFLLRADGQSSAPAAGWRSLFDGKTMAGWTTIGPVRWSVVDGALAANPSEQSAPVATGAAPAPQLQGFLRSAETFSDFELTAEFWAADNANSGLFIRCGTPANPNSLGSCYEINISDNHAVTPTGGIVGVQSPLPYRVKSLGKWSLFEVRAEGNHLVVKVNGETITDAHDDKYRDGAIGLQAGGPNGPGLIKFRNIKVRPLAGAR